MKGKSKQTKTILIGILTPALALLLAFCVLCIATMGLYSPIYLSRVLFHRDSSISDCNLFPERSIGKSDRPYTYEKRIDPSLEKLLVGSSNKRESLSEFVKKTDTTSFLIVKDDVLVYEQYANGYGEDSVNTSFSMAKSVVSLLIGKAIEDGFIDSVHQPLSDFIGEFKDLPIGSITIEELLSMRSGIAYNEEKFLWFGDDSLTYWHPDLRKLALTHTELTDEYGGKFHYNNYHPLLLGIVLERSTGMSVSEYFERTIWQKIGAKENASWSLDSEASGFEKMESGLNFCAADFIKIGSMVLHGGVWNGERIIDAEWIEQSAVCLLPVNADEYENSFLFGKNIGYKYMWYCTPSAAGEHDIFAWGKSDQILYISPSNGLVVLRTGKTDGGVSDWIEIIRDLVSTLSNKKT